MGGTGGSWIDPGAGPYIPEEVNPLRPLSVPELVFALLLRDVNTAICPYVRVGPTTHAEQQAGVVSVTPAGSTKINPHMPMRWARVQLRGIHHQIAQAEMIGEHVFQLLHTRHRELVTQPSSGNTYLVHNTQVIAGPSIHYDTPETWESLLFAEITVGTQPIS